MELLDWAEMLSEAAVLVGVLLSVLLMWKLGVWKGRTLQGARVREGQVSLWWVVGVLLGYFCLAVGVLEVASATGILGTGTWKDVLLQGVNAGVELVVWGVCLLTLGRLMVGGVRGWGLGWRDIGRGVGYGVVAMVVVYPLLLVLNAVVEVVLEQFGKGIVPHETFGLLAEPMNGWQRAVVVVGAAVVAPLMEELFFRGMLQTALLQEDWGMLPWRVLERRRSRGFEVEGLEYGARALEGGYRPGAGRRWGAIVITAGIFGAIHGSPTNFPVLFLLGVGLGYVYERTGNLWSSVVLHMLFNATSLGLFFLSGG